jgi:hypothetical protein
LPLGIHAAHLEGVSAMNRDSIERWQAKRISESLQPSVSYFLRLRERMGEKGLPANDPNYQAVCRAYDAMQALYAATHYLSCDGVGRPRHEDGPS